MEIWAKKNGTTLKKHTEDLLKAIEILPYEKLKIPEFEDKKFFMELLKFAAALHDLGKVSPAFQKRIANPNFPGFVLDFPDIRHNILSLFFINKDKVKELCRENESLYASFLSAIAFHHWKKDEKEYLLHINEDLTKTARILLKDDNAKKLENALKEHFKDTLNGIDIREYIRFDEHLARHIDSGGSLISINIIPPYTLYFLPEKLRLEMQMNINLNLWAFLSGFLMRADHFASLVEQQKDISINLSEIEKNANKINLDNSLKKKFGENYWQKIALEHKDKNLILIAPTGIGKTEFAFLWAEGEKFFYTLPLRVATNQIFERAVGYFNKDSNESLDPFINGNVGLLQSDADLYLYEKWENSKKDIEGETPKILDLSKHFSLPVNICTGDQIFPAALKYPQYEKIYATLGYSKLIIDEVQAYDPKACAIVVKMIEDIVSLGGKFLLMTATLPEFVEKRIKEKTGEENFEKIDYYDDEKIKKRNLIRHKIELQEKDILDDLERIVRKAKEGNRILIVLNTIKKAEEVFEKIKNEISNQNIFCDLLHSRFTLNERRKKEKNLEEEFNNPKPQGEKLCKILVATQVVEASLDIDADYLFTEIAPMDSLIQRMGRVMRRVDILSGKIKNTNKEFKYEDFYGSDDNVRIYYLKKQDRKGNEEILESGEGRVYKRESLRSTLEVLSRKSEIPEKEKQDLVNEMYKNIENSNYLLDFYATLSILNSGYVSENKEEAHKLFREIFTISLVEESKIEEIAQKIAQKIYDNEEINWFWFKKEIIAEYVINDNIWKYKIDGLTSLWDYLQLFLADIDKIKNLKTYCEGIWVCRNKKDEAEISTTSKNTRNYYNNKARISDQQSNVL